MSISPWLLSEVSSVRPFGSGKRIRKYVQRTAAAATCGSHAVPHRGLERLRLNAIMLSNLTTFYLDEMNVEI